MEKNKKIVMIDDNKDYVFTMKTFLERNEFDVVTAGDGKAGIELVKKEKPDLILLDVMMELLFSGFEVYRQLKIDPELKKIPLIGISGMGDEISLKYDKEKDSEYFDPDEFMEKPVDKELLLKKINGLLEKN